MILKSNQPAGHGQHHVVGMRIFRRKASQRLKMIYGYAHFVYVYIVTNMIRIIHEHIIQ